MKKNYFTDDEKILCASLVRNIHLSEEQTKEKYKKIQAYENCRSIASIRLKCENYAWMINKLHPEIETNPHIKPLSGVSDSEKKLRLTDSEIVYCILSNPSI